VVSVAGAGLTGAWWLSHRREAVAAEEERESLEAKTGKTKGTP